ncbi:DUF1799 domain-containing protein [Acidovorax sp. Root217]|uniref:DUF1799 domain-containing protein n=1 Tax=Acidovorax sp. Root217 TaxID=1736492 RepID=UPI00070B2FF1|nr:DUF1799 domain-containing protein [Acidovorax sp. Root217]KRC30685.1 hypothetical protein ASE31_00435 [Acidovorax sp. Root217]
MYERPPDENELAKWGLRPDDFPSKEVEVWPDNFEAYALFCSMSTQWRIGMAGPTGLDYNVLYSKLDRMDLEPDRYTELECDVGVIERAALEAITSKD